MASKMITKDAKASLLLFRSSILAAAKPKTVPSHGELGQALRISSQKPLAEAAVLRRYLYEEPSKIHGIGLGGVSDGRVWGLNADFGAPRGRGKRVVDEEEEEDDDDEEEYDDEDMNDDDGDLDEDHELDGFEDEDEDEDVAYKKRK